MGRAGAVGWCESRGAGRRLTGILTSVLLFAAVPACAQEGSSYRGSGRYTTGFETSSFAPCAEVYEDERWWLIADSAAHAGLQDAAYGSVPAAGRRATTGRAFVRLRGRITERGRYGYVGGYDREIRVVELLEVRGDSAGFPECR